MLFSVRAAADADAEGRVEQVASALFVNTNSINVILRAGQQAGALPITTDTIDMTLTAAAPFSGQLPIEVGPLVVAINGTFFRPISTNINVTLVPGRIASSLKIDTGIDVSLAKAGQPLFTTVRDMVIAGQADLDGAVVLTEPILLGIDITDPDFRSVDNGGKIQQPLANDLQFAELSTTTILSHNVVSHNPVSGRLVFDLELRPTWNPTQDYRVRISYGAPA